MCTWCVCVCVWYVQTRTYVHRGYAQYNFLSRSKMCVQPYTSMLVKYHISFICIKITRWTDGICIGFRTLYVRSAQQQIHTQEHTHTHTHILCMRFLVHKSATADRKQTRQKEIYKNDAQNNTKKAHSLAFHKLLPYNTHTSALANKATTHKEYNDYKKKMYT